jgi:hypothetical protein
MDEQIDKWREELSKPSGNFFTNQALSKNLINQLLDEDVSLKEKLDVSGVDFPKLDNSLDDIDGLNILAGLQNSSKKGYLTLFRAVRFPTYKRMYEMVSEKGYAVLNREQERILELYKNEEYLQKRDEIINDSLFWTQPQERVVDELPLFHLMNDAIQIHRAFRGEEDKIVISAIHIPYELIKDRKVRLISNSAIDLDYDNTNRDFEIKDFVEKDGVYQIDLGSLRTRGIDLHEIYTSDLPWNLKEAREMGILQDCFLLDIYRIVDDSKLEKFKNNTKLLKENSHFLHGFFGDQNVFGRRKSEHLPSKCYKVTGK